MNKDGLCTNKFKKAYLARYCKATYLVPSHIREKVSNLQLFLCLVLGSIPLRRVLLSCKAVSLCCYSGQLPISCFQLLDGIIKELLQSFPGKAADSACLHIAMQIQAPSCIKLQYLLDILELCMSRLEQMPL